MSEKHIEKLKNVPKLRFPEFRDAGEWEETTLDNIGKFTGGGTPSKSNEAYWNGTIPWISSSDISEESIYQVNISRFITEEALQNSATKFVPSNSILLVSRVGVGKLAITTKTICTSQDFTSFTPNKDNLIFLAYLLKSIEKSLISLNQGTSIRGFTREEIGKLMIRLPTLPEQQTIADCLSSLDDRLAAETQKLETLKAHKKGLMQQLFPAEGETLPKLRFPEFRDAGEWQERKLGDIAERISDGIHTTPIYNENGQYYFVNGNNLAEDKIVINESTKKVDEIEYSKYKIELSSQTILISINGTIGNLSFFNGEKIVLGKSACYINLKPNENKYFVFNLLKTSNIKNYFEKELTGSTIKNLSLASIKNAKAFFPVSAEQQTIADCLGSLDETIAAQAETIALLKVHKKGLMQQLFPAVEEAKR